MAKSNDIESKFPEIDYSVLPANIEKAINKQPYGINKVTKLTWDGRQFIIRIPKEIAEEIKLNEKWHVNFVYIKPLPSERDKTPILEIRLSR